MWLTALSSFCGAVYKKHTIELQGLLQYVANQLKAKHSLDLIIIKEVVAKMGGVEGVEEMTSEQIEATAGGELLRQEAASFTQVKNTRKSSQRLKDCLIESGLAVPLVLLMAQQGNCVVYQETEDDHLKLVGKLFDQCHDTLVQFGSFLASNLSQDDYTERLPPIHQLLSEFHVNSDIAFFLARPMFNYMIGTKYDELRKGDKLWKQRTAAERQAKHAEAAQMVMEPVTTAVMPIYPAKVWEDISPQFFTTFWSLTMYDLHVPEAMYEKEILKLKEAPAKLINNKELNSTRRKKEADRLQSLMERLQEEERRHKEHVERVMARLRQEKDAWFLSRSARSAKNETITQFLQFCLFPRCIFTSSDAIYAAKFVSVIHMLKTPNFSTLICYDRIFCDITYTVTSCTENEAGRYGRFLAAMLETVMKWHGDRWGHEITIIILKTLAIVFSCSSPQGSVRAGVFRLPGLHHQVPSHRQGQRERLGHRGLRDLQARLPQVALQDRQGPRGLSREQELRAHQELSDRPDQDHPVLPGHPESGHSHREEGGEGVRGGEGEAAGPVHQGPELPGTADLQEAEDDEGRRLPRGQGAEEGRGGRSQPCQGEGEGGGGGGRDQGQEQ